jgi:hypothetical protein
MDKTREEDDLANPRSPKRHAHRLASTPDVSAASAVAELDDAIWTSIIEFLPIPKFLDVSDNKKHEAAVAEIATTW